jgi:hypothetical protein
MIAGVRSDKSARARAHGRDVKLVQLGQPEKRSRNQYFDLVLAAGCPGMRDLALRNRVDQEVAKSNSCHVVTLPAGELQRPTDPRRTGDTGILMPAQILECRRLVLLSANRRMPGLGNS